VLSFPDCSNVKKLSDRNDYRLRVGKWRIIFTAAAEIVCIEEVKKRDEHTY
jgi:mRNA interferase RelE/StbE